MIKGNVESAKYLIRKTAAPAPLFDQIIMYADYSLNVGVRAVLWVHINLTENYKFLIRKFNVPVVVCE
ncbi:hypothetical protein KDA_23230 [Dictyobacter alpinus]|uniref:Uncharacterized protein n=1 Tax=Dictyobacter alpinus TaxID=2014873 RepID=A0A402B680_9CHLR|nr:hypothetical protein KDA_23230 [Dictyobacter alpinus]